MACCGLCRSKLKISIKKKKNNITTEKIRKIDIWIEHIEGPYDTFDLPSKSPNKPITLTNNEEITEFYRNENLNNSCISNNKFLLKSINLIEQYFLSFCMTSSTE